MSNDLGIAGQRRRIFLFRALGWLSRLGLLATLPPLLPAPTAGAEAKFQFLTIAGAVSQPGSIDGVGVEAHFSDSGGNAVLRGIATDPEGNLYLPDYLNNVVRKIAPVATVTTIAGLPGFYAGGSADGMGSQARFNFPTGAAVAPDGTVYVTDTQNCTIRKITPSGYVTTLAGLAGSSGVANGVGGEARFSSPTGIAVTSSGIVYVADTGNTAIRKITPAGVVSNFAGIPAAYNNTGSVDGPGPQAKFNNPIGLAVDASGNLYVADTANQAIRKITPDGQVSTFAGRADPNFGEGSVDGQGTAARFRYPLAVAAAPDGTLYVADSGNHTIRQITPAGLVTTIGGVAGQAGNVDGEGTSARFSSPSGIAVNAAGELFIFDRATSVLRKGVRADSIPVGFSREPADVTARVQGETFFEVLPTGDPSLFTYQWQRASAGSSTWADLTDGGSYSGSRTARLRVRVDSLAVNGDRFRAAVATTAGTSGSTRAALLSVTPAPVAFAFTRVDALLAPDAPVDGQGMAASFGEPVALALDPAGNLYVADAETEDPRKIAPDGVVTTLRNPATSYGERGTDGQWRAGFGYENSWSYFNSAQPRGIALDPQGNLYVSDSAAHVIRKYSTAGAVTILAGVVGQPGSSDGTGATAHFKSPTGLALDAAGNLYVADTGNCTLRKISPAGAVTTVAGQAGLAGSDNGTGAAARFYSPRGLAFDTAGNLVVADTGNHALRRVTPAGVVTTIAGNPKLPGMVDGAVAGARFNSPAGVALNVDGTLLVADTGNHAIRQLTADGMVVTLFGQRSWSDRPRAGAVDGDSELSEFNGPTGIVVDTAGNVFVADAGNNEIRKISNQGTTTTLAGRAGSMTALRSVAVASDGTLYVSGSGPGSIARLSTESMLSFLNDNTAVETHDGLAAGPNGWIYLVNKNGTPLQTISPGGVFQNLTSSPPNTFGFPIAVAVDRQSTIYLLDESGRKITKVHYDGSLDLTIGDDWQEGAADGPAASARFRLSAGVAVNAFGEAYVADAGNHAIRKIAADGVTSTFAGMLGAAGSSDGIGSAARFNNPKGVAVDSSGYVYVADTGNQTIRMITPSGQVTTIGGLPGAASSEDGVGSAARFSSPTSLAVGPDGGLYITEAWSNFLRQGTPSTVPLTTPTVTWLPAPVTYGDPLGSAQLNATASVAGRFEYSPGAGAILTPGTHTIRATFLPADETAYSTVKTEATLKVSRLSFSSQPLGLSVPPGRRYSLSSAVYDAGVGSTTQWYRNGAALAGGTGSSWQLASTSAADTGLYTVAVSSGGLTVNHDPFILGLASDQKVVGSGREVASNIYVASAGNTYDQILLDGAAAAITADSSLNQITRISYVDLDDDIVQVEFSGPGTLSLVLDGPTGPALPAKYNQAVEYMKGHAGIVITGATEYTNVSVFSVGRKTAVNQALFKEGVTYDGIADIAFIAIASANGKFGGVRTADANYFGAKGVVGLYAPNVEFVGPVYLGNVTAYDAAVPAIMAGNCTGPTIITGGDLLQDNGRPVQVSGLTRLQFGAGTDSHGTLLPARENRGVLQQNGQDVTTAIVANPGS